jgi:DNA-directed RNA polymerase specialized sigma24 family protein
MSESATLAEVLASLPDEERFILTMHYLRQMSPLQISQLLSVPEQAVEGVISSGKARLSQILGL